MAVHLSAGIHALVAARLGETETALRFLRQAAVADLELDPNSAGGIRIAGLGGLWQAIVLGFAGLGMDGDAITLTPRLPSDWRSVSFTVRWRGRPVAAADGWRYGAGGDLRWRRGANPRRRRNPHGAGREHAGGALQPPDNGSGVTSHSTTGRCRSRSSRGLDGVNVFVAAVQTGFGSFVTVYLVKNHWPPEAIGFALTIATLSSLFSQIPAGAALDSMRDKRRAVLLGIAGVGLAAMLLCVTAARPAVYLALAMQGLASSLIGPGIAAISLALVGQAGVE